MATELLTDPGHTRSDLRQIESAIRKGWVIPDMVLDALPKTMAVIALKGKPRDQIAAAKVLLAMKGQSDKPEVAAPQQTVVNVGVNVDNRTDTERDPLLAIAERVKAAIVLRKNSGGGT